MSSEVPSIELGSSDSSETTDFKPLRSPRFDETLVEQDSWDELLFALSEDDLNKVKELTKDTAVLYFVDDDGRSLLELSIFFNAFESFVFLVEQYKKENCWEIIDQQSDGGLNPLLRIVRKCRNAARDDVYIARILSVDINDKKSIKAWRVNNSLSKEEGIKYLKELFKVAANPLVEGLYNGRYVAWQSFLDEKTSPELYVLLEDYTQDFTRKHFLSVLVQLLDDDKKKIEALEKAYKQGNVEVKGQDFESAKNDVLNTRVVYVNQKWYENNGILNSRTPSGQNALHLGIQYQNYNLFLFFLNRKYPETVTSLFLEARAEKQKQEISDMMGYTNFDEFDIDARDSFGRTALFLAIELAKNEEEAIKFVRDLVVRGADPSISNSSDTSPLQLAVQKGFGRIVETLIYSVNSVFSENEIVIDDADQEKAIEKNVADIKAKGALGETFLHDLFRCGHVELMDIFLLEKGGYDDKISALFVEKDDENETPLFTGLSSKNLEIRSQAITFIKRCHQAFREEVKTLHVMYADFIVEAEDSFESADDRGVGGLNLNRHLFGQFHFALMKLLKNIGNCYDKCNDVYTKEQNAKVGQISLMGLRLLSGLGELFELKEQYLLEGDSNSKELEKKKRLYEKKERHVLRGFLRMAKAADLDENQKLLIVKIVIAASAVFSLDQDLVRKYIGRLFPEISSGLDLDDSDICSSEPSAIEEKGFDEFINGSDASDPLALHKKITQYKDEQLILTYLNKQDPEKINEMVVAENIWGERALNLATTHGYFDLAHQIYLKMNEHENEIFHTNQLGMNFIHDAFRVGELDIVEVFQNERGYFNADFHYLMHQRDNDGNTPLYLGMISKSIKARKRTATFIENVKNNINEKIVSLGNELNEFFEDPDEENNTVLQLQALLRQLIGRIHYFENPRYEFLRRHNAGMMLVYLSIFELMSDLRRLGELKADADIEDAEIYIEFASARIERFLDNMRDATRNVQLLDIAKTVALVAGSLVVGVGVGFLIGAFLAWVSGLTTAVLFGMSALEIGGAAVGAVLGPAGGLLLSKLLFFGFNKDGSEIGDLAFDVADQQVYAF